MNRTILDRLPRKVQGFLTDGHERSLKAKKNIVASFAIRSFNVLIGFMLVPVTLSYLDPTRYGLWLTISSVVGWLGFLDIGLGNGLRNKLAEALASGDHELARKYVSTTYAVIVLIMSGAYVVFFLVNHFIDWAAILNSPMGMSMELRKVVLVLVTFFSLQFILQIVGTVLAATQMPSINDGIKLVGNVLALVGIIMLTKLSEGSLLYVTFVYSVSPVIAFAFASIWFFRRTFKSFSPNIRSVDFRYFRELGSLGVQFFVLNIAGIVVFATDNLIISHILGPSEVTPYNIAYKYFGLITMLFGIVLTPFWSAFTDAFAKGDIDWIRRSVEKLLRLWMWFVAAVILMLLFSDKFYLFWVGNKIQIPFLLSALMGLYIIMSTWNNIFAYFINGIGKIRLQMYYGIVAMLINVPVSIFLARNLRMGSSGVILGTCVSLFLGFVLAPLQYFKLINGHAEGVWAK